MFEGYFWVLCAVAFTLFCPLSVSYSHDSCSYLESLHFDRVILPILFFFKCVICFVLFAYVCVAGGVEGVSMWTIVSSPNKETIISCFVICMTFLLLLFRVEFPILCWRAGMRMSSVACSLSPREGTQFFTIKHDVSCGYFIDLFMSWEKYTLFLSCWEDLFVFVLSWFVLNHLIRYYFCQRPLFVMNMTMWFFFFFGG